MRMSPVCPQFCGDREWLVTPISRGTLSPLSPLRYLHNKYIQRCSWYIFSVVMFIIGNGDKLLFAKCCCCKPNFVTTWVGQRISQNRSMVDNSQSTCHHISGDTLVTVVTD